MIPRSPYLIMLWWPILALAIASTGPSQYVLHILIIAGIYVILAQSLHLVLGQLGLLSLGIPAFFGIGAYAETLLSVHFGLDSLLSLVLVAGITFVSGLVIGVPSLRLSSHSFVIVTLSFAMLLQVIAFHWVDVTRGALGFPDIPAPSVLGFSWTDKTSWLIAILILDVVTFAAFIRIKTSRFGRALAATKGNEDLARAVGFSTFRVKLLAFAISGTLAGIAGTAYAHYITFIDPNVFGFSVTENLLIMVVLGGSGTVFGPMIGAVVFTVLPELLRFSPEFRSLLYGVLLLMAMLRFPLGLGELTSRFRRKK